MAKPLHISDNAQSLLIGPAIIIKKPWIIGHDRIRCYTCGIFKMGDMPIIGMYPRFPG